MNRVEEVKRINERIDSALNELIYCKQALDELGRRGKYVKRLDTVCSKLYNLIYDLDKSVK